MKRTLLAVSVSCVCLLSTPANADAIGLYVGGQIWANQADGAFGESTNLTDFNLKDEEQGSYFISIEHPLPFIPNAKLAYTTLDTTGAASLTSEYKFGDQTFSAGANASTTFDLAYNDYTLYYELFDNGLFSFDLGFTARDFDGDVTVTATAQSTDSEGNAVTSTITGREVISEFVPMLYASTVVGLPFTGFNLFAEGNFLSFDDHVMYDYQAGVSYELVDNLAVDVNVTAGYRAVRLELEDLDGLYTDLDFDGLFAGVVVHF